MAVSKVTLNGTTLMDATGATAEAGDITAPKTAMLANGLMTTGTGSGGTADYEELSNIPSINNVTLIGDMSLSDLGIYNVEVVRLI